MGGEGMLRRRERIARRAAHDLVLTMAKNGDHGYPRFRLDADVKRIVAERGAAFEEVVERSRDYRQHVPFFENLLGGGHVFVNAPGGGSVAWGGPILWRGERGGTRRRDWRAGHFELPTALRHRPQGA